MNNEIKEILYYWEKYHFEDCMIDGKECKLLYNYITNLQQLEQEHKKINGELREENSKLEIALQNIQEDYDRRTKENERLKDIVVEKDNQIKEMILQKTDYTAVNILEMKLEDYKSRCEKASEYFKYQLENLDFYEDTKARMLCAMGITLLQNGSEKDDR